MNTPQIWQPFDNGVTIGQPGSESGTIVRDEELAESARLTLERNASAAPFAITCGVYGWFFHTRFLADQSEAEREYAAMKIGLNRIVDGLVPDDLDEDAARDRTMTQIRDFVERFPT